MEPASGGAISGTIAAAVGIGNTDDAVIIRRGGAGLEGFENTPVARAARMPDLASTRISLMPAGTRNGTAGLSASATFRKSLTIGAARWPPVRALAERARLVVADINADHDVGRKADEPDVLFVVGGAGLAGDRLADRAHDGGGAALHDAFHDRGDLVGGHRIDHLLAPVDQLGSAWSFQLSGRRSRCIRAGRA